jgi:hypothetical protein
MHESPRRRVRLERLPGFAAVTLAGCSLVADLGNFDGAHLAADAGGTRTHPGLDATDTASDSDSDSDSSGYVADAGVEDANDGAAAILLDAGEAGRDSAADASTAQDAGGPWCMRMASSTASFCRDFDSDDTLAYNAGWDNFWTTSDCASLAASDYASPPRSLLLSTPALAAGANAEQEQFDIYVSFKKLIQLQFALKLENFDQSAGDVSLVRVAYQSNRWWVSLDFQQSGGFLLESTVGDGGALSQAQHPIAQPPLGVWTTVSLTVDLAGEVVSLSYDGTPILTSEAITAPVESNPALDITLGMNYLGPPAQPMQIYYDNILVVTP